MRSDTYRVAAVGAIALWLLPIAEARPQFNLGGLLGQVARTTTTTSKAAQQAAVLTTTLPTKTATIYPAVQQTGTDLLGGLGNALTSNPIASAISQGKAAISSENSVATSIANSILTAPFGNLGGTTATPVVETYTVSSCGQAYVTTAIVNNQNSPPSANLCQNGLFVFNGFDFDCVTSQIVSVVTAVASAGGSVVTAPGAGTAMGLYTDVASVPNEILCSLGAWQFVGFQWVCVPSTGTVYTTPSSSAGAGSSGCSNVQVIGPTTTQSSTVPTTTPASRPANPSSAPSTTTQSSTALVTTSTTYLHGGQTSFISQISSGNVLQGIPVSTVTETRAPGATTGSATTLTSTALGSSSQPDTIVLSPLSHTDPAPLTTITKGVHGGSSASTSSSSGTLYVFSPVSTVTQTAYNSQISTVTTQTLLGSGTSPDTVVLQSPFITSKTTLPYGQQGFTSIVSSSIFEIAAPSTVPNYVTSTSFLHGGQSSSVATQGNTVISYVPVSTITTTSYNAQVISATTQTLLGTGALPDSLVIQSPSPTASATSYVTQTSYLHGGQQASQATYGSTIVQYVPVATTTQVSYANIPLPTSQTILGTASGADTLIQESPYVSTVTQTLPVGQSGYSSASGSIYVIGTVASSVAPSYVTKTSYVHGGQQASVTTIGSTVYQFVPVLTTTTTQTAATTGAAAALTSTITGSGSSPDTVVISQFSHTDAVPSILATTTIGLHQGGPSSLASTQSGTLLVIGSQVPLVTSTSYDSVSTPTTQTILGTGDAPDTIVKVTPYTTYYTTVPSDQPGFTSVISSSGLLIAIPSAAGKTLTTTQYDSTIASATTKISTGTDGSITAVAVRPYETYITTLAAGQAGFTSVVSSSGLIIGTPSAAAMTTTTTQYDSTIATPITRITTGADGSITAVAISPYQTYITTLPAGQAGFTSILSSSDLIVGTPSAAAKRTSTLTSYNANITAPTTLSATGANGDVTLVAYSPYNTIVSTVPQGQTGFTSVVSSSNLLIGTTAPAVQTATVTQYDTSLTTAVTSTLTGLNGGKTIVLGSPYITRYTAAASTPYTSTASSGQLVIGTTAASSSAAIVSTTTTYLRSSETPFTRTVGSTVVIGTDVPAVTSTSYIQGAPSAGQQLSTYTPADPAAPCTVYSFVPYQVTTMYLPATATPYTSTISSSILAIGVPGSSTSVTTAVTTTAFPTAEASTTSKSTTAILTTTASTTGASMISAPTTAVSMTSAPTTSAPTTSAPTTAAPTTDAAAATTGYYVWSSSDFYSYPASGTGTATSTYSPAPFSKSTDAPELPGYQIDSSAVTCPEDQGEAFYTSSGAKYQIECYADRFGNDIVTQYAETIEQCIGLCDANAQCVDVSFIPPPVAGQSGPCYLKDDTSDPSMRTDIIGARKISPGIGASTVIVSSTSTQSSTTLASSSTPAPVQTSTTTTSTQSPNVMSSSSTPSAAQTFVSSSPAASSKATIISGSSASTQTSAGPSSAAQPSLSTTLSQAPTSQASSATPPRVSTTLAAPQPSASGSWVTCPQPFHQSNVFRLWVHIEFGNKEYEAYYVQNVSPGQSAVVPVLGPDRDGAARFYYDPSSYTVAVWHGSGCEFSGLSMDVVPNSQSMSPVFISSSIGSAVMDISGSALMWRNSRFGSWLVCEHNSKAELMWFDVKSGMGYDVDACSRAQLLLEYV